MTNIGKQIALLEKKINHIDNDLTKSIALDLLWSVEHKDLKIPSTKKADLYYLIKNLREKYKEEYYKLTYEQRHKSKQLDIEDVIKEQKRIEFLG